MNVKLKMKTITKVSKVKTNWLKYKERITKRKKVNNGQKEGNKI